MHFLATLPLTAVLDIYFGSHTFALTLSCAPVADFIGDNSPIAHILNWSHPVIILCKIIVERDKSIMPPKRHPPAPKTSTVSKRLTRRNPLPPTPKNTGSSNYTSAKVEAQPPKKGDCSRAVAKAKIVDSLEIIELSSTPNRSSPKKSTSIKSAVSTPESGTTPNKKNISKYQDEMTMTMTTMTNHATQPPTMIIMMEKKRVTSTTMQI